MRMSKTTPTLTYQLATRTIADKNRTRILDQKLFGIGQALLRLQRLLVQLRTFVTLNHVLPKKCSRTLRQVLVPLHVCPLVCLLHSNLHRKETKPVTSPPS